MKSEAVLRILSAIADLILFWRKKQREEKRQAENDAIEKDPAGWFVDEFGGDKRLHSDMSDNAGHATKTDIAEFNQNARGRDYD